MERTSKMPSSYLYDQ
ncbi:TPA: hypothetical protein ACH5PD_003017 [Escherichia coli]